MVRFGKSSCKSKILFGLFFAVVLPIGFSAPAYADGDGSNVPSKIEIKDDRFNCAAAALLQLVEGNLGALVMIAAGIAAIISAAFGGYKAAANLLAVATSAFILRSIVLIFFEVGTGASCTDGVQLSEEPGPGSAGSGEVI